MEEKVGLSVVYVLLMLVVLLSMDNTDMVSVLVSWVLLIGITLVYCIVMMLLWGYSGRMRSNNGGQGNNGESAGRWENSRFANPVVRFFSVLSILFAIYIGGFFLAYGAFGVNVASLSSSKGITLTQFNMVTNGMSYADAVKILGSEGELLGEVSLGAGSSSTKIYMWQGKGSLGANANFTFDGDKMVSKFQIGLSP